MECLGGLRVAVSWRFGTVTEPASEPRSAGGSPAAAHCHFEPGPCLQEVNARWMKMSKARTSLSSIIYCGLRSYYAQEPGVKARLFTNKQVAGFVMSDIVHWPTTNLQRVGQLSSKNKNLCAELQVDTILNGDPVLF